MRWKIKQEILAYKRREVDRLRSRQLRMHGKCGHSDFVREFFQARYATQLHWLYQRTPCPKRATSDSHVDIIVQLTSATNSLRFEIVDRATFVPVQMQTLCGNLFEMNFHSQNLPKIISQISCSAPWQRTPGQTRRCRRQGARFP